MKFKVGFPGPENPAHEDINNYGTEKCFFSPDGLEPVELRSLARDAVRLTASGCDAAGAKDVSHVKAFLEYEEGFLHANTVGGNAEVTVSGRDGKKTKRFRLVMNVVIYGLSEESISKATEEALEAVQAQYGLTRERAPEKSR